MPSIGAHPAPRLAPVGREAPLPLSYLQERLWNVERAQGGTATYNMPFGLRIRGALDVEALTGSLRHLVRRHESFRTTFLEGAGGALQQALGGDPVPVLHTDVRGIPLAQRGEELERRAADEARRVFDLTAGPPLRLELLQLDADDYALLINMHHIISDGWSLGIMVRELAVLYESRGRGIEDPLPCLPVQYADYAVWQRTRLRGDALDEALDYWRDHLRGAPVLDLPADGPRPAAGSMPVRKICFVVPAPVTSRLRAFCRRQQATLFMVFTAAWAWTLGRFAAQDDVPLGTSIANRGRREVWGVIGLFSNNLALRLDFDGVSGFADALCRTKRTVLAAYERQDMPFQLVVDALAPARPAGRRAFFDVTIVESSAAPWPRLANCQMDAFGAPQAIAKYDLALEFWAGEDEISGKVTYATPLHDTPTVERIVRCLVGLLERAADNGRASVHDVPLA